MSNIERKKLADIQKLVETTLAKIKENTNKSETWTVGYLKQTLKFIKNIIDHGNVYNDEDELDTQQQSLTLTPAFHLKPCPHCASTDLVRNQWALIDNQETVAIECNQCKCGSPLIVWNKRVAS